MRTFVVVARMVFIVTVALVVVTSVFSCLAAVSARGPRCVGHELLDGYKNDVFQFLSLPLFGIFLAALVRKMAQGRDERLRQLFEVYNMPVLELASIQVTFGMVVAYSTLFGMLSTLGLVTGISVVRYNAIATYCLTAAGLN